MSSAIFRCDDRQVVVKYLGDRRWELSGSASWSGLHEGVTDAIRDALHLGGEIPYDTKRIDVSAAHGARGTIRNNTFPTDLWFVNLDGLAWSYAGASKGVAAAILECLVALRLRPTARTQLAPPAIDCERFSRSSLEHAPDLGAWAHDLEEVLSLRLRAASDPESDAFSMIQELKALGQDLWSFDESDDFALWTYDYHRPPPGPRLTIHFAHVAYEEPQVSVTIDDGRGDSG